MSDPALLLEEISPNGNMQAIVEDDDRVVFMYLRIDPQLELPPRTCWIRNRLAAPAELDVTSMREGRAPLMPAGSCNHPNGAPALDRTKLRFVWFEEGDAAALLDGDDILAVVPGWSGTQGFDGYARDCTAMSPLAWPLGGPAENAMFDRVRRADEFWKSWSGKLWQEYSLPTLAAWETVVGRHDKYYAIDKQSWPPKALVRFDRPDRILLTTIGVCIRPQPMIEQYMKDPRTERRIELACAIDPALVDEQARVQLASYISAQTNLPWNRLTWLGAGHTIPCDSLPVGPSGERFTSVLLESRSPGAPAVNVPPFRNDPIRLLWMIPITSGERAWAEKHSSETLAQRLFDAGVSCVHKDRRALRL